MDLRRRDTELEELLAKYGAGGRGNRGFQTPERSATPQYRREGSRDEDVRSIKNSEHRFRPILSENNKRPSPIRHYNDLESSWHLQSSSPLTSKSPVSRSMSESKAYSMAMKALQDRVKQLEQENERLRGGGHEEDLYRGEKGGNVASLTAELREKTAALKTTTDELRRSKDLILHLQTEQHHFRLTQSHLEDQNTVQKAQIAALRRELEGRRSSQYRKIEEEDVGRYVVTEGDCLESTRTAYFGENTGDLQLVKELETYDQQYKTLLKRSQTPGADIIGLRAELNAIAGAMETKKGELEASRSRFPTKSFDYD